MKTVMRFQALDLIEAMARFQHLIDPVMEANRAAEEAARKTDEPNVLHPEYPEWVFEDATITNERGWVTIQLPGHGVSFADADDRDQAKARADQYFEGAESTRRHWAESLATKPLS